MAENLTPWERHAAGAGMKRFSYSSVAQLEKESLGGFLVTCPFRREKSATKEVVDILAKYIGACSINDDTPDPKEQQEGKDNAPASANKVFSLIKLSRSGLVLLSTCNKINAVSVAQQVFEGLRTGAVEPPSWCYRLVPLQAICLADKEAVFATLRKLIREDAGGMFSRSSLKFAVVYTRRDGHDMNITLERKDCFEAGAKAVLEAKECATVDLTNPEVVILVEVLPIVGLNDSPLCGVALLPQDMVTSKPRLSVKPLSRDEAKHV